MISQYPQSWLLLTVSPLILLLFLYLLNRSRRDLQRLGYSRDSSFMARYTVQRFIQALFFYLFFLLSVIGLMDLYWGREPVSQDSRGSDVALVVDLSYSMLAQDNSPSRLGMARETLHLLLQNAPNTRFSLVPFKGNPTLAVPLTEDKVQLERYITLMEPYWFSSPGSNMESALNMAVESLDSDQDRHRIILLISDGEELEGQGLRAARHLAGQNISLIILGAGEEDFLSVELEEGEFLHDPQGNLVLTARRTAILQEMARVSDGIYLDLNNPGTNSQLLKFLEERSGPGLGIRYERSQQYRIFLFPALFFILLYHLARRVSWKKK